MGSLNLGNELKQCLLSLDFVRILMFAHKQDTWLPTSFYNTKVAHVLKHSRALRKRLFSLFGIHSEQSAVVVSISGIHIACAIATFINLGLV